MARYYFDVTDVTGFHRDDAGDEFDSLDDAQQQCQALVADIAREELPNGPTHQIVCEVRDEAGRIVYRGELTYRGTSFEP